MRLMVPVLLGLLAVLGFVACGDDGPERLGDPSPYSDALTHPDSLIHDLMASYRRRETGPYANLLARDFRFYFQEDDITPEIPLGTWNFEEDSTGTRGLFEARDVLDIRVDLTWDAPVEVTVDGQAMKRVRVTDTRLDVDEASGITLRVEGDRQEFHFRAGRADLGEDLSRLYLWRWEDLGRETQGAFGPLGSPAPLIGLNSWGKIKALFR